MGRIGMAKWGITAAACLAALAVPAAALDPADKCEADKLKFSGKYAFCRMKAEAKAVKTGNPADYLKCLNNFWAKFGAAESKAGGSCPTENDLFDVTAQVDADTAFLALKLSGERFVDNGDGTVTDTQTGLMWEQKDDLGGIHDKDNVYDWSDTGTAPDGTAFTTFLGTLNNGESADGTTISGCFAGHCDWRLPTSAELQTILLEPYPCGTSPCIDPIFGPTQSFLYWSATTYAGDPSLAWFVSFDDGDMYPDIKTVFPYVRAVRGGL